MRIFVLIAAGILLSQLISGCRDLLTQHDINLDGAQHGEKLYSGAKNCTVCHGIALNGAGPVPGCNDCHADLWNNDFHTQNRGGVLHHSGLSSPGKCGTCHGGSGLTGKRSRPSCYECHDDYWTATANHTRNEEGYLHAPGLKSPFANCSNSACHGTNLTGGDRGQSCYTCHGDEWNDDDD